METRFIKYSHIKMMNDVIQAEIIEREKFIFSVSNKVFTLEQERQKFSNIMNRTYKNISDNNIHIYRKFYNELCDTIIIANRKMDAVRRETIFLNNMLDPNSLN